MSPVKALRFCTVAGCSARVPSGPCPAHQPDRRRFQTGQCRYDIARWRDLRAWFLQQHPLCGDCKTEGKIELATIVDHRTPHRGNESLMYDVDNLAALCRHHHGVKTAGELWHG